MPNLTPQEDPPLFTADTQHGQLALQFSELIYTMHEKGLDQPTPKQVVESIRGCTRTPEVAAKCSDAELFAFFQRVSTVASASGNV